MKTFSKLNESARTTDTQPGNDLAKTGLTNHYTPIENILINVGSFKSFERLEEYLDNKEDK